jgi:hypothetical protein
LEFEADRWIKRAQGIPVGEIDMAYAQGMIVYTTKQVDLFRDIAVQARETATAPQLVNGKQHPRALIVDPLTTADPVMIAVGVQGKTTRTRGMTMVSWRMERKTSRVGWRATRNKEAIMDGGGAKE